MSDSPAIQTRLVIPPVGKTRWWRGVTAERMVYFLLANVYEGKSMSSEASKGIREATIFERFLAESDHHWIAMPFLVEKREPPEPDILCHFSDEGPIAFELVELADTDIIPVTQRILRSESLQPECIHSQSDCRRILSDKISRHYATPHPIELLCYTDGCTISLDEVLKADIEFVIRDGSSHPFRRIWLMGDDLCIVFDKRKDEGLS
jgi:hypothetical protein